MIKVEMELYDEAEFGAFQKLVSVVQDYRVKLAQERQQQMQAAMGAPYVQAPLTAETGGQTAPVQTVTADPAVVGHISPSTETPKVELAQVQEAAQKYAQTHGLDKALAVVKEFGASRVQDVKDPVKLALLLERLSK